MNRFYLPAILTLLFLLPAIVRAETVLKSGSQMNTLLNEASEICREEHGPLWAGAAEYVRHSTSRWRREQSELRRMDDGTMRIFPHSWDVRCIGKFIDPVVNPPVECPPPPPPPEPVDHCGTEGESCRVAPPAPVVCPPIPEPVECEICVEPDPLPDPLPDPVECEICETCETCEECADPVVCPPPPPPPEECPEIPEPEECPPIPDPTPVPPAPTLGVATLTWTRPPDEPPIVYTGYIVLWGRDQMFDNVEAVDSIATQAWLFPDLDTAYTWCFKLRSVTSNYGNSIDSDTVCNTFE